MNNKPLILLVGPSGSGKTTIADILEKEHGMKQLRSYTTRKPRFDGEDGHIFVSDEEFDKLENIIGYTEFDGYRYCATAEQANEADVYIIDPRGIREMDRSKIDRQIVIIGLTAPNDVRILKMLQRGDSIYTIVERMDNDKIEFDGFSTLCDSIIHTDEKLSPASIAHDIVDSVSSVIDERNLYSSYPRSSCPFCGGDGIFNSFDNPFASNYLAYVSCNKCECSTKKVIKESKNEALESAAELWNQRYKEDKENGE